MGAGKKKVAYALVGFGGIAETRIAREGFACDAKRFRPLRNARLKGVFDVNSGRRASAEALGLEWYSSFEEVLRDDSLDAVFIATNNATHAKLAIRALKAGKHVIVEKPLATTLAHARKMNRLAKSAGLSLAVDHMMVHNVRTREAKRILAAGRLGAVNDSCFHMEFAYGYDPAEAASWRCSDPDEMGGPVGDVASHCFYVAEFVFGRRISKLASVYLPKLMDISAEDGAYVKFFFEDGTEGSVRAAFSERRGGLAGTLANLGYEIYGDKAVLRGYGTMFQLSGHPDEPVRQRLEIDDGRNVREIRPRKAENIYRTLIENHARSVLEGAPLSADDAVHNIALCAAAHKSARNGGVCVACPV